MKRQQPGERSERTAVYLAPAAYGEAVDPEAALAACKGYIVRHGSLWLTRVYRDNAVVVTGRAAGQKSGARRTPLSAAGNDAWKRLLMDVETSAVEAVVLYAARTVAPTVSDLKSMLLDFFLPCGVRFVDVEAGFDTAEGPVTAEDYCKARTREYRSTVRRAGPGETAVKTWADGTRQRTPPPAT
ncbi:MAG: hypothetical protein LUG44_09180 [Clostridiales bacterium]|nr:hypothetical protein [Clostridiales bacterium]